MASRPTLSDRIALPASPSPRTSNAPAASYSDVLGGEIVLAGEPTIVALANSWIIINVGADPQTTSQASLSSRHRILIA